MQILCGTDIIEIDRIKKSIERKKERFINKIYTQAEIDYCEEKKKMKYQHYAARFAAKEAAYKAVSSLISSKMHISWKNVELLKKENGKPYIRLVDIEIPEIENIEISISHCKKYAIANVIVITK